MAIKFVDDADLTTVGDAIRAKTGGSDLLTFPTGMAEAIAEISGGGGGSTGSSPIYGSETLLSDKYSFRVIISPEVNPNFQIPRYIIIWDHYEDSQTIQYTENKGEWVRILDIHSQTAYTDIRYQYNDGLKTYYAPRVVAKTAAFKWYTSGGIGTYMDIDGKFLSGHTYKFVAVF